MITTNTYPTVDPAGAEVVDDWQPRPRAISH
jgi:hypothetical protein